MHVIGELKSDGFVARELFGEENGRLVALEHRNSLNPLVELLNAVELENFSSVSLFEDERLLSYSSLLEGERAGVARDDLKRGKETEVDEEGSRNVDFSEEREVTEEEILAVSFELKNDKSVSELEVPNLEPLDVECLEFGELEVLRRRDILD